MSPGPVGTGHSSISQSIGAIAQQFAGTSGDKVLMYSPSKGLHVAPFFSKTEFLAAFRDPQAMQHRQEKIDAAVDYIKNQLQAEFSLLGSEVMEAVKGTGTRATGFGADYEFADAVFKDFAGGRDGPVQVRVADLHRLDLSVLCPLM